MNKTSYMTLGKQLLLRPLICWLHVIFPLGVSCGILMGATPLIEFAGIKMLEPLTLTVREAVSLLLWAPLAATGAIVSIDTIWKRRPRIPTGAISALAALITCFVITSSAPVRDSLILAIPALVGTAAYYCSGVLAKKIQSVSQILGTAGGKRERLLEALIYEFLPDFMIDFFANRQPWMQALQPTLRKAAQTEKGIPNGFAPTRWRIDHGATDERYLVHLATDRCILLRSIGTQVNEIDWPSLRRAFRRGAMRGRQRVTVPLRGMQITMEYEKATSAWMVSGMARI